MPDFEGTEFDTELMEMLRIELTKLHEAHPYAHPGLFDAAVDNIRNIRATILVRQGQVMSRRLSG